LQVACNAQRADQIYLILPAHAKQRKNWHTKNDERENEAEEVSNQYPVVAKHTSSSSSNATQQASKLSGESVRKFVRLIILRQRAAFTKAEFRDFVERRRRRPRSELEMKKRTISYELDEERAARRSRASKRTMKIYVCCQCTDLPQ